MYDISRRSSDDKRFRGVLCCAGRIVSDAVFMAMSEFLSGARPCIARAIISVVRFEEAMRGRTLGGAVRWARVLERGPVEKALR
jgi:predicted fused transcriptional regulator/phosphomethylpyrimidine kinase